MGHPAEERTTRREFLEAGATGMALGLCGCALFITTRDPDLRLAAVVGEFRIDRERRAARRSLVVEVSGEPDQVLDCLRPDGSVGAVTMACTHLGCDVEYSALRNLIVCPCHGCEYDVMGGNLKGPASRPLHAYAVRIEGSDVVVKLG